MDILVWGQIAGFTALVFAVLGHQVKMPRIALRVFCCSASCWVLHFLLLAHPAGAVVALSSLFRNICATRLSNRLMKIIVAVSLFVCCCVVIPAAQEAKDFLPLCAGALISSGVFFRDKPLQFRFCYILGEVSWLIYALMISSVPLGVGSVLIVASIVASILRHDLKLNAQPAAPAAVA